MRIWNFSRYTFGIGAALALALGACAQNGVQSGPVPANPSGDARVAITSTTGIVSSKAPKLTRAPRAGWLSAAARAKSARLMYVSSPNGNTVDIFPEYGKNVAPIGQITNGINEPTGMAVDKHGNLYVANVNASTVTVYPRGSTSPSKTYSTGLQLPVDVAVGNDGTVYVSCFSAGFVVEYPPRSMSPSLTISLAGADPFGVALDASNNLYIAYTTGVVYEYAPGSSSGTNLGLSIPAGNPHGLTFDRAGDLLISVSNAPFGASAVYVYPPGSKTFSKSITQGVGQPFMMAFDRPGRRLFLADFGKDGNGDGSVLEYRFSNGKALTPESQGVANAAYGVAVTPPEPL
jgi:sugar lactone lactonase YvrE